MQTVKLRTDNKATLDSITAQNTQSTALSDQATTLRGQIDTILQNNSFFTDQMGTLKSDLSNSDLEIHEIVNDAPKGLNITNVTYLANEITIMGVVSTQDLVLTYARSLRTSGRFLTVTVTNIDTLPDGTIDFTLLLR
jgi:hypothetical protein